MERKEYQLRVGKGKTEERDGQVLKRYPYVPKIGAKIAEKIESGWDVKITAIGPEAIANAVKAIAYAQVNLGVNKKYCVVSDVYFEQLKLTGEERTIKTKATVLRVTPIEKQ